jgi:hypothetical protein
MQLTYRLDGVDMKIAPSDGSVCVRSWSVSFGWHGGRVRRFRASSPSLVEETGACHAVGSGTSRGCGSGRTKVVQRGQRHDSSGRLGGEHVSASWDGRLISVVVVAIAGERRCHGKINDCCTIDDDRIVVVKTQQTVTQ